MHVLLTGAYGFVGSNLSTYLAGKGYELYALDVAEVSYKAYSTFYSWNELEEIPWDTFDAVIHLAGKAHDTKKQTDAQTYFDINTGLTQQVFDCFLKSSIKKFIFFSSVKAVADKVEGILTEEVVPNPVGPYGESKIAAEKYISDELLMINGELNKSVYIFRPSMIHGPGNKGNLNLLYNVVKKGIPWPLGAFENRRSFTSIDNLCYVIERLLTKEVDSGIYHMADDESLSTNELISLICKAMGKKPHIWRVNKHFIKGCSAVGTIMHLPLNKERLQKLTENYIVSNQKIKEALEITHMPVRAEEGMIKTILSFFE